MKSLEDLAHDIERKVERSEQLEKLFRQFLDHADRYFQHNKLKGVKCARNDESLSISILDRHLRFEYSPSFKEGSKGVVAVTEMTEEEEKELGSFSFDGQGKTDIDSRDQNDPYHLHEDRAAATIVLHWINEALQEK